MQVSPLKLTDTPEDDWRDFVNTNLFCFARLSSDHKVLAFNQTAINFLMKSKRFMGAKARRISLANP